MEFNCITSYLRQCRKTRIYKIFYTLIIGIVIGVYFSEFHWIDTSIPIPIHKKIKYSNKTTSIGQHNHTKVKLSDKLHNEVKILCWVMTNPDNHKTKVTHILNTWGFRCNKLLVISSKDDNEFGILGVPVGEGRINLWEKVKEAFRYIYQNYLNEYDWFLKADDDTYVIVENLRLMLYEYDSRSPIYFGYKFSKYLKQGYMSGGSGYVLSREALIRFIEIALPDPKKCFNSPVEDLEIGRCLENVGVIAGDSRDFDKRGRFFIFAPQDHLLVDIIDLKFWYWEYMFYKSFEGLSCCSDNTISFHYVSGKITDILEYFVYHAKPYGIIMRPRKLPNKKIYVQRNIP